MNKKNNKLNNLKYKFNRNILYRDTDELLMAYNKENSDMYEFNAIGGEIFKLMEKEESIENIFNILTKEYSVTIDDIYEDVFEIINRMLELNIIERI